MTLRFDSTYSSSKTFQKMVSKLSTLRKHTKNARQIQNILNICDHAHSDIELVKRLRLDLPLDIKALPNPILESILKNSFVPFCIITGGISGIIAHQSLSLFDSIIVGSVTFASSLIIYILLLNKINPYYEIVNYLVPHIALRRVLLWNGFERSEKLLDTGSFVNFFNRSTIYEPAMQLATGFLNGQPVSLFTFQCATGVSGKKSQYKWMGVMLFLKLALLRHEFRNDIPEKNCTWQSLQALLIDYKRWSVDISPSGSVVIAVNDTIINKAIIINSNTSPFERLDYEINNFNPNDVSFFFRAEKVIKVLQHIY